MEPFGLLGRSLSHSISPEIHALLRGYPYVLFEREPDALAQFFAEKKFSGLNVTIPYKKDVIPYCAALSETARAIGSVNTITVQADGSLYGDNTDYFGFLHLLQSSGIQVGGKRTLVLGTGGASLTVNAVLRACGTKEILPVSRSGKINYKNVYEFSDTDVIINTTPVGMYPHNGERLLDLRRFAHLCGVVDLIYNPALTPLLYDAAQLGIPRANGLPMLVAQAWLAAEKFTRQPADVSQIEAVTARLAKDRTNLVLIGMPGCGKSTQAKRLGAALGRTVYDTDTLVEQRAGCTIPELFARSGEAAFRDLETEVCAEVGKRSGAVIATGGGAVLREQNRYFLKQNAKVIWLRRDARALPSTGRPLSKDAEAIRRLERERLPVYEAAADAAVDVAKDPAVTLQRIMESFK